MAKTKKPEQNSAKGSSTFIGFEKQIWNAANILRGNIDASEYKHVILGLIFLKYLSDKFEDQYNRNQCICGTGSKRWINFPVILA